MVTEISDHLPVFGFLSLEGPHSKETPPKPRRNFNISKKETFLACLKNEISHQNLNVDPNTCMDTILSCFKNAINSVFPYETPSKNKNKRLKNPWMTKKILKAQSKRDHLKMKWIKSGRINNSTDHINYKQCKNGVTNMIRQAKQKFIGKKCDEAKGDSKKLWKAVNLALKIQNKPSVLSGFIKTGDSVSNETVVIIIKLILQTK